MDTIEDRMERTNISECMAFYKNPRLSETMLTAKEFEFSPSPLYLHAREDWVGLSIKRFLQISKHYMEKFRQNHINYYLLIWTTSTS